MVAFSYVLLFFEDVAAPKAYGFDKFSNNHMLMKKKSIPSLNQFGHKRSTAGARHIMFCATEL